MRTLLLVEPNYVSKTFLIQVLQGHGFGITTMSNGVQALDYCRETLPNLIISSVSPVGMDGYEFCYQLRKTARLVPFIFIANHHDVGDFDVLMQGYYAGADGCLTMPFAPKEVIAKVNALIDRTEQMQAEILRRTQDKKNYSKPVETPQSHPLPLTIAEEKVFQAIAAGHSCKAAGFYLHISVRTIQTHLNKIYKKLGLKNRYELMIFALKNGYTSSSCY